MIRPMREQDLYAIQELEEEIFSTPWSIQAFRDELHNDAAHYLVIDLDHRIIGYGGFWKVLEEGHITNIAIHLDFRRKGHGAKLLESMINYCRALKINAITLEVRKSNQAAIHMYSSYGFYIEGYRKGYYTDPKEDAAIMWLKI